MTNVVSYCTGGSPYPGLHSVDVYEYLCSGNRMKSPVYCPNEMYVHWVILVPYMHLCCRKQIMLLHGESGPCFRSLGRAFSVFPERHVYQRYEFLSFKNSKMCNNSLYNFLQLHPPSFETSFALYAITSMNELVLIVIPIDI